MREGPRLRDLQGARFRAPGDEPDGHHDDARLAALHVPRASPKLEDGGPANGHLGAWSRGLRAFDRPATVLRRQHHGRVRQNRRGRSLVPSLGAARHPCRVRGRRAALPHERPGAAIPDRGRLGRRAVSLRVRTREGVDRPHCADCRTVPPDDLAPSGRRFFPDAIGATLPSVAPQSPQPPKMDHPSLPASVAENLAPWPSSTPREPQRKFKAAAVAFVVLAGGAAWVVLASRSSHRPPRTEGSVGIVSAGAVVALPSGAQPGQGTVVSALAPEGSARPEPPPIPAASATAPTASPPAYPPNPLLRASTPRPTVDKTPANHRPVRPPSAAKQPTPAATPHVLTQDELMLDRK